MDKYIIKITNLKTHKVYYLDSSDTDEFEPVFRDSINAIRYNFYDKEGGQVVVNRYNESEAAWAHLDETDIEYVYELVEVK